MSRSIRNVEFFVPDFRSRIPQVTVRWSSLFSFGASFQRRLKNKNVEIGYWAEEKSLVVYEVPEGGHPFPKHGRIVIARWVRKIYAEGISLPAGGELLQCCVRGGPAV